MSKSRFLKGRVGEVRGDVEAKSCRRCTARHKPHKPASRVDCSPVHRTLRASQSSSPIHPSCQQFISFGSSVHPALSLSTWQAGAHPFLPYDGSIHGNLASHLFPRGTPILSLPPPPFPPCKVPVGLLSKPVRSRSGFSWPLQVPLGV